MGNADPQDYSFEQPLKTATDSIESPRDANDSQTSVIHMQSSLPVDDSPSLDGQDEVVSPGGGSDSRAAQHADALREVVADEAQHASRTSMINADVSIAIPSGTEDISGSVAEDGRPETNEMANRSPTGAEATDNSSANETGQDQQDPS